MRIERHREDLLRIARSLRLGTIRVSDLMLTLQSGGRVSRRRQAVAQLRRMVKTLQLPSTVSDVDCRRRILVQLGRGESRHAVARGVFSGRRGQLRHAYRQVQEDQRGAPGLVGTAIALRNSDYIGKILAELTRHGEPIDPAHVARLSPTLDTHLNFLGHDRFALPPPVASGEGRVTPLSLFPAPDALPR